MSEEKHIPPPPLTPPPQDSKRQISSSELERKSNPKTLGYTFLPKPRNQVSPSPG